MEDEEIILTRQDIGLLVYAVRVQAEDKYSYQVLLEKLYDIANMEDKDLDES